MNDSDVDKIDEHLAHLPEKVREKFRALYEAVLHSNSKLNLLPTSNLRTSGIYNFVDCVCGLESIESVNPMPTDIPIYDFGSGNGFPGLILAITRPDLTIHLVEVDSRRAEFLTTLAGQLGLVNARVLTQSMESLAKSSVSFGLVRNVSSIADMTIRLNSIYREGGYLFHFKTSSWSSEIAKCPTQVFTSWEIGTIGEYSLPVSNSVRAVVRTTKLK